MNIMPFVGFYWRQHQTITALVGSDGKKAALAVDFLKANAPLIKAQWPRANQNGLLDDLINTLDEAIAGPEVQS